MHGCMLESHTESEVTRGMHNLKDRSPDLLAHFVANSSGDGLGLNSPWGSAACTKAQVEPQRKRQCAHTRPHARMRTHTQRHVR
eukprot:880357-Pleurochrysis_carterae.AAC.1